MLFVLLLYKQVYLKNLLSFSTYIMRKHLTLTFLFIVFFSPVLFAQTNYAISMDGTSTSYADLGTINPTGNFSTGITIECWIKWGGFGSWGRLLDMGNGSASDNILFATENTSNNLRFEVYQGGSLQGLSGPTGLVTGRWYHVAVTENASGNTTLYVDGVAVANATIWLPNNVSRANCYIGKSNWAADAYLNGSIDEMRIWNVTRTQQEIKSYMFKSVDAATTGLVAYYHCDENGGTTFTNSTSGAGAGNGTAAAALAWVASPIQYAANALNFDGSNDYAVVPNVVSSDFTVEYWMKTSSTGPGNNTTQWYGGNGIVDAEVPGGTNDWGTSLTGPYLAFGVGNPDITIHSTSAVNTGNWVHVAATWQQSTGSMKLYINGVLEDNNTGSTNLRNAPPRIVMGELQTSIQPFSGTIDEVRIWNVVRTQAEIQAYMNKEINPTAAEANNLVAYYTFNQNITDGTNTGVVTLIDQKNTNNATLNNFALSGTSSNFVAQQSTLAKLPIELTSFTATKANAGVLLRWETASELNTLDFIVERSGDGRNWSSLAHVPAAGNSSILQKYSYVDAAPINGKNYYRLLQTDLNGGTTYSEIRTLKFSLSVSPLTVIGNPVVNGLLQIQFSGTVQQPAALYDADGKLLLRMDLKPGLNNVDVSKCAKGIYWLRTADQSKKLGIQ